MSPAGLLAVLLLAATAPRSAAQRAEDAFAAGDYDQAATAAAEAYAAEGDPKYLYAQAQAERFGGRCELAIEHYREFIAAVPSSAATLAAQDNIAECETLLERAKPAPEPEPEPTPPPATEATDEPEPRARWARDPLGGALVGTGAAVLAIGGGLYGQAHLDERAARQAHDVATYGDHIDRAYALSRVGLSLMIAGGTLVVGGAVRWAVVARRVRTDRVALRPGSGGLVLRF
ncbi:hypothetical protein [Paraliomyxa miuraensis]|uniref:hypothetical protein n=1 Tax=Paraliomyxa miuraensis TaxID=376150 RepID=UPI002258B9F2|nr:hypothetical protein [Paraliomyxa miuraensis]MCX4247987.1 hypothetical protein [Paraliomyxa miuraensis]